MSQATMEDEDTAMDTHDLKLSIPETSADGARSGSPESGVSTPRYSEHQSGSKRLRTKDGWEEVEGGSDPETGGPNRDDEPGTSAGMLNVTPVEVGQLVLRTKAVCSELADVIVRLARESTWTDSKEADTARKRELCDQLRTIQRRLDRAESTPELESLRAYLAFAFEQARPATSVADLLDDELEVILGKVATKLRSPKQLMALSALSRRFRRLVRQPAVWRELDVSQHRAYMTDSLLLRQIVRNDGAFSLLRRVNFGGCTRVTDAAIRKVLALSGKTLTHLYLEGCALLTTELARYAATACPNLEVLDLTACASVDTLEVLRLSDEDWPKMRELELMDTGALAGRTPQETFERLRAALAARRERFAEQKKAEAEAAERAAEEFLPFGGAVGDRVGASDAANAPSSDAGPAGDAPGTAPAAAATGAPEGSGAAEPEAESTLLACRRGPALCMDELCEYVNEVHGRLAAWGEGQQVAACDHAMVAQGAMSEHNYVLNMLPDCGHVICVECEQKSRVNMTRPHGADHYVYPCPVCAQDMPEPGGFTITLAQ